MTRKRSILIITIVAIFGGGVYYLLQIGDNTPRTQEQAIEQAQEYRPKGVCTMALVPAVHEATGARYTFPSGCLAPGWKPER
jgi:amino acid permease